MPKFSIIIPVYNVAPYLRECLDSVLSQTVVNWEAICVDDGSTDGSGAILDEYAAKDERVRVIHQKNAGVSAARNAALDVAKGDWLWFVDGDDIISSHSLSCFSDLMLRHKFDACWMSRLDCFNERAPVFNEVGSVFYCSDNVKRPYEILFCQKDWAGGHSCRRLLRADFFQNVKYPEGVKMMEDDIHFVRCLSVSARWIATDLCVYGYRNRADSACSVMPPRRSLEVVDSLLMCIEELQMIPSVEVADWQDYARRSSGYLNYIVYSYLHNPQINIAQDLVRGINKLESISGVAVLSRVNRVKLLVAKWLGINVMLRITGVAHLLFGMR